MTLRARRRATGGFRLRRAWLCLGGGALSLAAAIALEARTSALQSYLLSQYAARLSYAVEPGPSPMVAFPGAGPFDERRGHSRIPELSRRLEARGYRVAEQARISPALARLAAWGVPLPYTEPPLVGLVLRDSRGRILHDATARTSEGQFRTFEEIPALVVDALLFIENRELGEHAGPWTNPAVDWRRLAKAGFLYAGSKLGLSVRVEGGSTLATQLEKYRHSPDGRTRSVVDKLRQMTSASLKAYLAGSDTRDERREIVLDYLNTMPLAAAPGVGEVNGLGQGLRAWFGLDLEEVRDALVSPETTDAKAHAFKHVLALLYAVRAPTYYLAQDRPALQAKIDGYAGLLQAAGLFGPGLRDRVREAPLRFMDRPPGPSAASMVQRKISSAVRRELTRLLDVAGFYELDRLHLHVDSTADADLQEKVTRLFHELARPEFLEARGLRRGRLLARGDPAGVVYSLMLLERTPRGNLVRVQSDSLDRPFDLNEGMKLELGSTAKLRTLAHYLELVVELHRELSGLVREELRRRARLARDPITRWAAKTLGRDHGIGLDALLGLALDRAYSASPDEVFFTGGGAHSFVNFDPRDDGRSLRVREAVARSTNLVFVRLMRDLVRFHEARLPYHTGEVLERHDHPDRRRLLEEFADEESRRHLARAYSRYRGLAEEEAATRLLGDRARSPRHLAILFYAWHPAAGEEALAKWLERRLGAVAPETTRRLARAYGSRGLTLEDHGRLLKRHPLEVWCAGALTRTPDLSWDHLLATSEEARRVASSWLFRTRDRAAQDARLRSRFERDAFVRMAPYWRRLGFPFERLVPSYATALGSSSDRPAALADLMGIIVNDGVRRPSVLISGLRFAAGTPYETFLEAVPRGGEQVMPAPMARALRDVLGEVVERGTARRLKGAFAVPDGETVAVGGKTGSGDNRYETFSRGGRLASSRAVSRTAAFAFHIGQRYFGVITASVSGPGADEYVFTSALPLAVLELLAPDINERLAAPAANPAAV